MSTTMTPVSSVLALAEAQKEKIAALRSSEGGDTLHALFNAELAIDRFISHLKGSPETTVEDLMARVTREKEEIGAHMGLLDHYAEVGTDGEKHDYFRSSFQEFPKEKILTLARERSESLKGQIRVIYFDEDSGPVYDPISERINAALELNNRFIKDIDKRYQGTYSSLKETLRSESNNRSAFLSSLQNYKKQVHVNSGASPS